MNKHRTPYDVLTLAVLGSFIMIGCTRSLIGTQNLAPTSTLEPTLGPFFPSPTPRPDLPTPFPTLTPTATQAAVENVLSDPVNDGISCQTGASVAGAIPPEVDIGAAWVETRSEEEPSYLFSIQFPRLPDLQGRLELGGVEFLAGVELLDPNGPIPADDGNWYFNQTGNISYNFGWNREFGRLFAWKAVYDGVAWVVQEGIYYPAIVEENRLEIQVPVSEIPVGSRWLAVATNFEVCDVIGLEGGLPALPLE